ncbi:hypothetical protein [Streptococcus equi]
MAVIAAPKIVLLDEPTNDVDPIRRIKLWLYLKRWRQRDISLLLSPIIF